MFPFVLLEIFFVVCSLDENNNIKKVYSPVFLYVRNLGKPKQCAIYVCYFIKSVVKWSVNSVRLKFFMGIAFRDFISV